ncbi:3-isopropylmalate dehydratase small subunit [Hyphococcus sp.]|uniref:3-isopropylmalate dehydratase small subunit n=1 Tax=Hyphococcus sp. TaxID=2038636 RepID=UPI0035C66D92
MKPFTKIEGVAAALRLDNVDTDVIIPMDALLSRPRDELGKYAFEPLRYKPGGSESADFVLNKPVYRKASILIAGRNFGCGSSREGAVHALAGFGVRAVIAPTYGDIFYSNCIKNGVLPVRLNVETVHAVMDAADEAAGAAPFRVDLVSQTVMAPGMAPVSFDFDPALKQRLIDGEDEVAMTLRHQAAIRAWQTQDRSTRSWAWTVLEGYRQ